MGVLANHWKQCWLTSVIDDNAVQQSLVLAESLARTRTTRSICVIVSTHVSQQAQLLLRTKFHHVFNINFSVPFIPKQIKDDETRAKLFAFSLVNYEKCVFIPLNSLFLENSDKLFDYDWTAANDFTDDWNVFGLTPGGRLCQLIHNQTGTKKFDMKQCMHVLKENTENFKDLSVWKLSVENGRLDVERQIYSTPSLVKFINVPKTDDKFVAKLKIANTKETTGLIEKTIIQEWLNVYDSLEILKPENGTSLNFLEIANHNENEPIAIIGMGCRLPGANNLEEFWDLLYSGQDAVCKPPPFRWTNEHTNHSTSLRLKETEAGFLKCPVDQFDAKFFGIPKHEAEVMDPQCRLLHEVLWEALGNAGIDPHKLYGTHSGIFTGSWLTNYQDLAKECKDPQGFFRTYMGNSIGATAARLSFLLGLTGPCFATESGCSSAMVALNLAVKSLRRRETRLCMAGGVNLILHPFDNNMINELLSPGGKCKTFDKTADGFGRAEGCGVLVLKRLGDALRDRDNIWALIRGSAVSQEGLSDSLGTSTVDCEALAMELALKDGDVFPGHVSFVETHGTGTAEGDAMEVKAIAKAYTCNNRTKPLVLGAVKTNVGHTEACSGITSIIKTVLAMHHQLIPKHLNLDKLNPEIHLESIPAIIPLEPIAWPRIKGETRLAGVSSFGITGTDGHVIIEEAPDYKLPKFNPGLERPLHLIKFSARSESVLYELLEAYQEYFKKNESNKMEFANVAYTVNTGRASFEQRAFLVAQNNQDAVANPESKIVFSTYEPVDTESSKKICFLFTGQGSQYPGMAKLLWETSPVFRFHFDQCDLILREKYDLSIYPVLWENSEELSRTIYSQVSIFVIEYCLLRLWESWGIKPDLVLGHSLGEFCAAVAAGVLKLKDALKLVIERSKLIDNLPKGSMLVVRADRTAVANLMQLKNVDLDIAAINSEDQTVVSGNTDEVHKFLEICTKAALDAKMLEASHAFHSRDMDPMLEALRRVAESVSNENSTCQYISGMEGKLLDNPQSQLNAEYWVQHTRQKVNFIDACEVLKNLECKHYLEIGAQPILSSFVMQNLSGLSISCYPSLRQNTNDWQTILNSLGRLYLLGYQVDWKSYDSPYDRVKIPNLPVYPFSRKSYWVDCEQKSSPEIHPLLGHIVPNATAFTIFESDLSTQAIPYLTDHCIGDMIVFPGAAFLEMCMSAGYCVLNSLTNDFKKKLTHNVSITNLRIEAPLELREGIMCRMQTVVSFIEAEECFECKVYHHHQTEEAFPDTRTNLVLHATALLKPSISTNDLSIKQCDGSKILSKIYRVEPVDGSEFYNWLDGSGLTFGNMFKGIQCYWPIIQENGQEELVVELKVPSDHDKYLLHPLIIDIMFQAGFLLECIWESKRKPVMRVPVFVGKLYLLQNTLEKDTKTLYCHVEQTDEGKLRILVASKKGVPIALLEDLELLKTSVESIQSVLRQQSSKIPDSSKLMNYGVIH